LRAFRQRPGANVHLPPFEIPSVSRTQLRLRALDESRIEAENIGRCRTRVNGAETPAAILRVGDVLEVGAQVAFLCLQRPLRLAGDPGKAHPFGEADPHGIVGESEAVWELRRAIRFAAARTGHVLVLGDSGSGKELVAAALHALSGRSGAFVSRNAATLPETLVDAELFGNAANYPNAGMRERKGLVGAAHGGTLFLDEFAELGLAEQTHLLRVLDQGEYQRLGEASVQRSSLRLVGATNRPESALREDVRARFEFTIRVPALSARLDDVPLLVRHLLRLMTAEDAALRARFFDENGEPRVAPSLIRTLVREPPRGNLRGLRNLLWSALSRTEHDSLELPSNAGAPGDPEADAPDPTGAERIQQALSTHDGSLERTWRALGLSSRFALMRLMKKHGIQIRKRPASTS
jgi:two-component system nitrogen regulation response regulator GlnG/two-component system response regulator HydG